MPERPIHWIHPGDPADSFPPVATALTEPDGLLAAGGDLDGTRLLVAYRQGIFPWYERGQPLLWWSPDPRCLFLAGDFALSARTRRTMKHSRAELSVNTDFEAVVRSCAAPRRHQQSTWITPEMLSAYRSLHAGGWAHSIEIRQDGELIGGLYGLAIGRAFFGESMFSRRANTSKFALAFLDRLLTDGRLDLVDCQVVSAHLLSLGARRMPRPAFIERLQAACDPATPFAFPEFAPIPVARLLPD